MYRRNIFAESNISLVCRVCVSITGCIFAKCAQTRKPDPEYDLPLVEFLNRYKQEPLYAVADLNKSPELAKHVHIVPFVAENPHFIKRLESSIFWASHGGTTSVMHNDSNQHNINCLYSGQKDVVMYDPSKYSKQIQSKKYGMCK